MLAKIRFLRVVPKGLWRAPGCSKDSKIRLDGRSQILLYGCTAPKPRSGLVLVWHSLNGPFQGQDGKFPVLDELLDVNAAAFAYGERH